MKTLEELHKIRTEKKKELDLRINTKADTREKHILVCHGTGCTSSNSAEILAKFKTILKEKKFYKQKRGCYNLQQPSLKLVSFNNLFFIIRTASFAYSMRHH